MTWVATGCYGDLIGVSGDPLMDVAVLQSVTFVMKGGEVIKQGGEKVLPH
jgi:imidazolonepropionase-like amidohydrolase